MRTTEFPHADFVRMNPMIPADAVRMNPMIPADAVRSASPK
jgi:hypothetical protein